MATIKTAIMVQDSMSPALRSMSNACRILINNFEDMQTASSNPVDLQSLKIAKEELNNTNMILNQIEQSAQNANNETRKMPSNFENSNLAANKLLNTIKNIALAVGGISILNKLVSLSDEVTNNRARLSLIVDDGGSLDALENKIFATADKARVKYLALTSTVSQLGSQASNAFSNTDQIIKFGELLNKTFTISGMDTTAIESVMYNLTQSLSSGKLLGNDYRILKQNAPQMIQYIQDFYGVTRAKLDDMVTAGKVSAQDIKKAMFATTNDINTKFEKMPMTWNQLWIRMQNVAIKALDPVLKKINALANNQQVQQMFNMFIEGASLAAQAILSLIETAAWLYSILEPLAPVILGIVGAYIAFNVISAITSGILTILAIIQKVQAAASMMQAGATLSATAAQYGLNTALYACPIVWIVVLIMALIVALTYLWFTNDKVAYAIIYLWDMLVIGAMTLWLGCKTVFYGIVLAAQFMLLGMIGVCYALLSAWYAFETGLEAVGVGILYIFQWLYNGVLGIVNGIIAILNKIPGVSIDYAQYANFADKAMEGMMDNVVRRNEDLQSMLDDMNEVNNSINENKAKFAADLSNTSADITNKVIELESTRQDRTDHRNDWINGASSAINDALNADNFKFNLDDGTLGDIAGDTKKIADNSEISEEDLKYLIDIAERDTVNRFTTASVNITMNNNNNINEEQDIDGIVEKLATKLEEELQSVADGVHT